jgi:hypothetical protein
MHTKWADTGRSLAKRNRMEMKNCIASCTG